MRTTTAIDKDTAPAFFMIAGVILMGTFIVIWCSSRLRLGCSCFDLNVSQLRLGGASLPVQTWMILSNIARV